MDEHVDYAIARLRTDLNAAAAQREQASKYRDADLDHRISFVQSMVIGLLIMSILQASAIIVLALS